MLAPDPGWKKDGSSPEVDEPDDPDEVEVVGDAMVLFLCGSVSCAAPGFSKFQVRRGVSTKRCPPL